MIKLTLLLPLKDRKKINLRLVKHLKKTRLKFQIIIADGSKKSQYKIFSSIRNHKILYKRFAYDKDVYTYLKKLYLSSKFINTEYCAFIENDEFIVFDTYNYLCKQLDKNQNLSFITARLYNFNIKKNKQKIIMGLCRPNFNKFKKININSLDTIPTCYEGVHRSKSFKKNLEIIIENSNQNLDISTFSKFFHFLTALNGNLKFVNNKILSFRQANTDELDKDKSANKLIPKIKTLSLIYNISNILNISLRINQINKNDKLIIFRFLTNLILKSIKKDLKKTFKLINHHFFKKQNKTNQKENIINSDYKKIYIKTVKI